MRRAKYLLVSAFDVASVVVIVGGAWLALAEPAAAYVDPSVMTYTIQALAGVAVALSAVLGVVWRRARRWLLRALRIDENAGKVVEGDVSLVSGDDAQRRGQLSKADDAARDERSRQGVEQPQRLPWGARFVLALLASVTLSFMTIVSAPLEIVATNASGLSFSPANVWASLAVAAVVVALVVALVVSALKGRAFDVALAVLVALALAELVQALFLNAGLPAADGQPVAWDDYTKITLGSAAAWLAIIVVSVLLAIKKPSASKGVSVVTSFLLVLTSAVSLGTAIFANASEFDRPYVTNDGLYSVSSKSNVIVLVLDFYDTQTLEKVVEQYPDVLDELGGFTWFRNSVGEMIPTRFGIPTLVTGRMLDTSKDVITRSTVGTWFQERNLVDDIGDQGYSVGIYSDSVSATALQGRAENIHGLKNIRTNPLTTIEQLVQCALYRNMPWAIKPSLRYYTDDLNRAVIMRDGANDAGTAYVTDDAAYFDRLSEEGLSTVAEGERGAFRFIHLMGDHAPYTLDENAQRVSEESTDKYRQGAGAFKIVSEYLRQLKELGVYDNSTIVITADHGDYDWSAKLKQPVSPILLVKPAGAGAEMPCQVSDVPTGHMDYAATIREAVGLNVQEPTVFEVGDEPRVRYFYNNEQDQTPDSAHADLGEWEYKVDGHALDFSSWTLTGRFWPMVD